jgi:hypothetical protein
MMILFWVFFGIFIAEEVDGVGDKGSGDTKMFDVQFLTYP